MEPKSSEWRPGPTVCRCCFAEGCYKDISTEYFWMGKREVYSEMLQETFDVSIEYSKSGGPNSNSRLICEPCISRLRDASDFKRQVVECERTFTQHLDPGRAPLEIEDALESDKEVKLERIKLEKAQSDDDFDDRHFGDDDDDDDLDDQPLTKLASKIPKKESVDILDLLDNAKVAKVSVKRKATAKAKITPAKKLKSKKDVKPSASKPALKPEKKKKDTDESDDAYFMAKRNAEIIVNFATVYPFRLPGSSMVCVYCFKSFPGPLHYRQHMREEHKTFDLQLAFAHFDKGFVKVDCTELACRICSKTFNELKTLAEHLHTFHKKKLNLEYELGLKPFLLRKNRLSCGICDMKFNDIRSLSRHARLHFGRYTCETCGKTYSAVSALHVHVKCYHSGAPRVCVRCKMHFNTFEELKDHQAKSKKCWPHICNSCGDRFFTWFQKQKHLMESHGHPKKTYTCIECGMVFDSRDTCRKHFRLTHTDDVVKCGCCNRKFGTKYQLRRHMIVHTGERSFECPVCSKSFSSKFTLKQHIRIHSAVKMFKCTTCDKQFNQKVSWKNHMKSRHPEMCEF